MGVLLGVAGSRALLRPPRQAADALQSLSVDALRAPLADLAVHLSRLEQERRHDSATLSEAVRALSEANVATRDEARGLAHALSDNRVRGVWGEVQLRRVLEQSGMTAHADFVEQRGVVTAESRRRPDVIVRLPNDRRLVIDAKAPLDRFLEASACTVPADRVALLAEHARAVHGHVVALARRSYAELVPGAVDFVVLFVPGDAFLSAALEGRPALLEESFALGVVLASPSTLFALLRGVACGWRERRLSDDAQLVADAGRELYERLATFVDHHNRVGAALGAAVRAYNQAGGSLDHRLLPSARRLADHGAGEPHALADALALDELPRPSRHAVLPEGGSVA
jgi:DNA recombination protein RmuC